MELEKLENDLLEAIYKQDYEREKIDWKVLGFESDNHKASVLQRLERLGLITIDENTLIPGGQRDQQYGTAIVMVWSEGLHITRDGIKVLKK